MKLTYKTLIFTLMTIVNINMACSQQNNGANMNNVIDTCYKKFVSDSIVAIIDEAKDAKFVLHTALQDSMSKDTVRVSKKIDAVVRFVIFDDGSFQSDNAVKGMFRPWTTIIFECKKKKSVSVELDFGLWKWRIVDAGGKVVCTRNMGGNRKQFFRIVGAVFPDNQKLKIYYEFINQQGL